VVEHACSITSLMLGETLPSITKDMDTYTFRLPIGVCAGIAPFNFPAMIPLWMFPIGMVCGNTYLMKPSERVPGCTMLLAKLLQDAGAPDGTLNIIHGQHAGEPNEGPSFSHLLFIRCVMLWRYAESGTGFWGGLSLWKT
jgi:malonate-semialdehyde dehydrogenase (acetylating)/methylmalonate-semialdehyde dehydrogenase